jgi:hypothetical protein
MTWTDIGPTETAAAKLVDLMLALEAQRVAYVNTGAPVAAANAAHVIDELFEAWIFLCNKVPAPSDGPTPDRFATWLAQREHEGVPA